MFRKSVVGVTVLLMPLLLSACATQQPASSGTGLSENEAYAAFMRGCTRSAARQGTVTARHRAACDCGWRVTRRHMTIDEIANLGQRSKQTGRPPQDDPKFRAAVADMRRECR